jgi:thiamine-phosphate pyrophosphorylase
MTSRQKAEATRPAPRLYLVTETVDDADAFARALETVPIEALAAVLLQLPQRDERSLVNIAKTIVPLVQGRGTALLLAGHADLVARAGADGAHLADVTALQAALPQLKPDRIAGAGGLRTRHDAMLAGEVGADYAMFGDTDATGARPPFDVVLERVGWWSEIFQPPCVAFAAAADEIAPLVQAGADFIAVGAFVWRDPRGPGAAIAAVLQQLASREPV